MINQDDDKDKDKENCSSTNNHSNHPNKNKNYDHTVAILTYPRTSRDQIANEAILLKAMECTVRKLSIVIRCRDSNRRTRVEDLRRYVGEVYSLAWDCSFTVVAAVATEEQQLSTSTNQNNELLDVIVYPQNLPNAAPESWLYHRRSLQCICSADEMLGWYSSSSSSSNNNNNNKYANREGQGYGGLKAHCDAVNDDRLSRDLEPVQYLKVDLPDGADAKSMANPYIQFLEDYSDDSILYRKEKEDEEDMGILLGGWSPSQFHLDDQLYDSVAVGGTFDALHYGHRKLLTLAVSSVRISPNANDNGKLLVGVTSDEMLRGKKYASYIAPVEKRIQLVKEFIANLAPGIKNKVRVEVIVDAFGPTANEEHFTALVLSHETLPTGLLLNEIRSSKGFQPLTLLCTRRTEANAMSSTTLRQMRMRDAANK